MKKRTEIILVIAIIGTMVGTLIKLQGHKITGDVFLGVPTLFWLFFIYSFILQIMKKRQIL
jgi:hypothetical protein